MSLRAKRNNLDNNPLKADLDHILTHTRELWEELRGKMIFITGGTGFFGCWLLESFAWTNDKLKLNAKTMVLSRNPEAFAEKAPHLYHHPAIQFLKGDIKDFVFPEGRFSYLIHGAVYRQAAGKKHSNLSLVNEMLSGTRRVLDFSAKTGIEKMLLVSSGAVYGQIPPDMEKIPENFSNAFDPTDTANAYSHAKRITESLSVLYAEENNFAVKIARCFTFIGPYLQLNGRFALSDFILNALLQRTITIKSDGKTVRSYLYMSDLAIWLWTILFKGINCRPYNVGSELPVTIHRIAESIAKKSTPPLNVSVLGENCSGVAQHDFVPDTTRSQFELGLRQTVSLDEAVEKTIRWYRSSNI